MRLLRRTLFAIVAVIAVVFAVTNRVPVTVSLWPLPFEARLPLYLVVLGAAAIGLLIGATISWIGKERMWLRARSAERRAESWERRAAADRRAHAQVPQPPVPAAVRRRAASDDE